MSAPPPKKNMHFFLFCPYSWYKFCIYWMALFHLMAVCYEFCQIEHLGLMRYFGLPGLSDVVNTGLTYWQEIFLWWLLTWVVSYWKCIFLVLPIWGDPFWFDCTDLFHQYGSAHTNKTYSCNSGQYFFLWCDSWFVGLPILASYMPWIKKLIYMWWVFSVQTLWMMWSIRAIPYWP